MLHDVQSQYGSHTAALPDAFHEISHRHRTHTHLRERQDQKKYMGHCNEGLGSSTIFQNIHWHYDKHYKLLGHNVHPSDDHLNREQPLSNNRLHHGLPHPQRVDQKVRYRDDATDVSGHLWRDFIGFTGRFFRGLASYATLRSLHPSALQPVPFGWWASGYEKNGQIQRCRCRLVPPMVCHDLQRYYHASSRRILHYLRLLRLVDLGLDGRGLGNFSLLRDSAFQSPQALESICFAEAGASDYDVPVGLRRHPLPYRLQCRLGLLARLLGRSLHFPGTEVCHSGLQEKRAERRNKENQVRTFR